MATMVSMYALCLLCLMRPFVQATLEITLDGIPQSLHDRERRSIHTSHSLPQPENVQVKEVDSGSIHLTWELPKDSEGRNLEVKVMIYPVDDSATDPSTVDSMSDRRFVNLDPGKLYTFIIATANEYEMCDPIVINQDTIPLQPDELLLKTFDYLDLELTFLGEIIPHRIDTSGIEAKWTPPNLGECDCYDAEISPREGHMITPSDPDGKPERGSDVRQFIHLVPGKLYTIKIWSTTCGVGVKGPLRSSPIERRVIVPPLPAGEIQVVNQEPSSFEICWPGPAIGHFNSFLLSWYSETDIQAGKVSGQAMIKVDGTHDFERNPDEVYCHIIGDDLLPCEFYQVSVTTAHDEIQALTDSLHRSWTLPSPPREFHKTDFGTEFIDISWQAPLRPRKIEGYEITISPRDYNITLGKEETSIHIGGLNPGTRQDIVLQSFCSLEFEDDDSGLVLERVFSMQEHMSQATRPLPPLKCKLMCLPRDGGIQFERREVDMAGIQRSSLSGKWNDGSYASYGYRPVRTGDGSDNYDDYGNSDYDNNYVGYGNNTEAEPILGGAKMVGLGGVDAPLDYDIQLNQEIYLNISWLIPQKGSWDGFVVSYSPFINTGSGLADKHVPPFYVGAGTTMLEVFLPRTDQQYTVYIRSVSDGIESEPLAMAVVCGTPMMTGNICQQRRDNPAIVKLDDTEVEVGLNHLVLADWVFDDPLTAGDDGPKVTFKPGGGFRDGGNTMVIKNTDEYCASNPCDTVKIHFQVCTHGFGCQPKLITAACPCEEGRSDTGFTDYPDYPRSTPKPIINPSGPIAGYVAPDSCCGSKPFHSDEKMCCHDQLFDRDTSGETFCCGTRKYDKFHQQCCMEMEGYGTTTTWAILGASDVCNNYYR